MSELALRIGDLSKATGKTVRALRYYEELGLLSPSDHTAGGFRLYHPEDAKRVGLIDRLQELGFSLDRIQGVVKAWKVGGTGEDVSSKLQLLVQEGLVDVRGRIQRLQAMEQEMLDALKFLATCRSCQEHPGPEHCRECDKGDHQKAKMPSMVDALVR